MRCVIPPSPVTEDLCRAAPSDPLGLQSLTGIFRINKTGAMLLRGCSQSSSWLPQRHGGDAGSCFRCFVAPSQTQPGHRQGSRSPTALPEELTALTTANIVYTAGKEQGGVPVSAQTRSEGESRAGCEFKSAAIWADCAGMLRDSRTSSPWQLCILLRATQEPAWGAITGVQNALELRQKDGDEFPIRTPGSLHLSRGLPPA